MHITMFSDTVLYIYTVSDTVYIYIYIYLYIYMNMFKYTRHTIQYTISGIITQHKTKDSKYVLYVHCIIHN